MKVLLHTDIEGLGYFGDVVEVSDGYARNYLLPQKLGAAPTESNMKTIQKERSLKAEERRLVLEQKEKVAQSVNDQEVTIKALANKQGHLFGSVTEKDVAQALQEAGHEVQSQCVRLPEHLRQLGDYEITLQFAEGIESTVHLHIESPTEETEDVGEIKVEQSESE